MRMEAPKIVAATMITGRENEATITPEAAGPKILVAPREEGELPDVGGALEREHRGRRLRAEAEEVGGNHHCPARQSVGPDAAGDRRPAERDRASCEDDPEASAPPRNGRSWSGPKRPCPRTP
jgi:hypothetical protein